MHELSYKETTGALDLDITWASYFTALVTANAGLSLAQFGLRCVPAPTPPTQVIRQEACRVRRTFCRPRPASAKVSTNASATSGKGGPRFFISSLLSTLSCRRS